MIYSQDMSPEMPEIPPSKVESEKLAECKKLIDVEITHGNSDKVDISFKVLSPSERRSLLASLDDRLENQKQNASLSIDVYKLRNLLYRLRNIGGIEVAGEPQTIDKSKNSDDKSAENKDSLPKKEVHFRREVQPEKWKMIRQLAEELGKEQGIITREASRLAEGNRGLMKEYSDKPWPEKSARMVYWIHPDLETKLRNEFTKAPSSDSTDHASIIAWRRHNIEEEIRKLRSERIPAPDGWKTNFALSLKLSLSEPRIREMAYKHYDAHPDWFWEYLGIRSQLSIHYSPELVETIMQEARPKRA